jgi:hypothetical protein
LTCPFGARSPGPAVGFGAGGTAYAPQRGKSVSAQVKADEVCGCLCCAALNAAAEWPPPNGPSVAQVFVQGTGLPTR